MIWDVRTSDRGLVPILTSQVLKLLHRQVVVASAAMAALLPPALVALLCFCVFFQAQKEVGCCLPPCVSAVFSFLLTLTSCPPGQ